MELGEGWDGGEKGAGSEGGRKRAYQYIHILCL